MRVGFFLPPYAKAWFEPKVTQDWDVWKALCWLSYRTVAAMAILKKLFFSITTDFMPSARFLFLVLILMFLGHQFLSLTCRNAKVRFIRAFTNSCLTVFSAVLQSRDYEKNRPDRGQFGSKLEDLTLVLQKYLDYLMLLRNSDHLGWGNRSLQ